MSNEGFVMVKVSVLRGPGLHEIAAVDESFAPVHRDRRIHFLGSALVRTRPGSSREVAFQARCGEAVEG